MEKIDGHYHLPVLTYIIKIIYKDDKTKFSLNRDKKYPSLVLTCIPNGELSALFHYDIVRNYKTYEYCVSAKNPNLTDIIIPKLHKSTLKKRKKYTHDYCVNVKGFREYTMKTGDKTTSKVYFDPINMVYWWLTSDNKVHKIRALYKGATMRVVNDILKKRYDSNNIAWTGYKEFSIKSPLP